MSFTAAICPCCSANIEVPRGQDRCFCAYCGSQILTEAAVAFAKVRVEGSVQTKSVDFVIEAGVLKGYHGESRDVVIPDGVHAIAKEAFDSSAIRSIVIPEGVVKVNLHKCSELESVSLPSTIRTIEMYGCKSLERISLPQGMTEIDNLAFNGCHSLGEIEIPGSVTSIGYAAFRGCFALKRVSIPNSVTVIGEEAFSSCSSLESISIPDSVTSIRKCAFFDCKSLREVSIPDSVTSMGEAAFGNCSSLETVEGYKDKMSHCFLWTPFKNEMDRAKQEALAAERKTSGRCQHCGGKFKGVFAPKCSNCGKTKDY